MAVTPRKVERREGVMEEMSSNVQPLNIKNLTPSQAFVRLESMEAPVKSKRSQKI